MGDLVLICARAGSKGLPGKNIKPLAGLPLIGWSINTARQLTNIDHIVVSTDGDDIAECARHLGAETPFMRPQQLAQDNSPEWLVWRHAIDFFKNEQDKIFDHLIVLPPTAPMRSVADVENCRKRIQEPDTDMVITMSPARRNPWFNMVCDDGTGHMRLVNNPDQQVTRRQDAPAVFDITTVAYITRPDYVMQKDGLFAGEVRAVEVPPERAIDIDDHLDFQFAEFLAAQAEAK